MRRGSRGEGVKQLQQKLGMSQADGIFGPATERAVRTFQQSQGIQVDGIVGPETRARIMRLQSDTAESAVNEDITISGDAEDLLRMMQLAGAKDAKAVDVDDINPGQTCGHRNGDLARSIELMADEDWDNSPEEEYSTAKDIATASGNDLHKSKGSHYKAAGGDNPMALEDQLREKLAASYAEKKR